MDTGASQVIEELEELMQSSPDPEVDPEGDEEEEEEEDEEEDAEANAEGDGGGRGMEPIVLCELHTFSPTFNNCSHEGMGSRSQAQPFLGAVFTKLDIRRWLSGKNEPFEIFLIAWL